MTEIKKPVVVTHAGHPAAFKKVRCPHCGNYAVVSPHNDRLFSCGRCGKTFKNSTF